MCVLAFQQLGFGCTCGMSLSIEAVDKINQMDVSAAGDLDKPPTPPPVIHKAPAASPKPVLGWATTSTAPSTAFSLRSIQDQEEAAGAPPGERPTHGTVHRPAASDIYKKSLFIAGLVHSCLCSDEAPSGVGVCSFEQSLASAQVT